VGPNNSARRLNVVLTIAGLAPEFGGPSRSVPALAEALARENVDVDLVACESEPGYGDPILPDANLVRVHLLPVLSRQGHWRAKQNDFYRALCEGAQGADTVIHDNGLWLPTNHATASTARTLGCPLVISPRGMLSAWELKHHGWKKRVAWMLFQRHDLLSASALHATSEQEMGDFRRAGFGGPISVVPNGVDLSEFNSAPRAERATRIALCVTRLHAKKGLMNLVEAWSEARPHGWQMVIAGSDEDRHRVELESAIAARGLEDAFEFVGPVDGERKQALYREADVFILPSHSENFGMSIAEALASGVPVITTRGTPWKDLVEHRCGWWEDVGAVPLANALREAIALSDEERRQMGLRGRQLVEQKYSWQHIAKEMKSLYAWLLNQGDRPACVVSS
jgi:glycosyltransferase involved in cell wall biosynthesis